MYARMVIGEAAHAEQIAEFAGIYQAEVLPRLRTEPGFQSASFLVEDGGAMAISLTIWHSKADCLNYHSSLAYRQLVERTRHLLQGDFVVRLFREV